MKTADFGSDSAATVSRQSSYTTGPALPAEQTKPPWRPKTAGWIAFFFGPLAGAQIVAISLRRMGHADNARQVRLMALGFAALEAAILYFIPEVLGRFVGIGGEIAFLMLFPPFMEKEFSEWQAAHPDAHPSSGWTALGWGLLGVVMFFVVLGAVMMLLAAAFPSLAPK